MFLSFRNAALILFPPLEWGFPYQSLTLPSLPAFPISYFSDPSRLLLAPLGLVPLLRKGYAVLGSTLPGLTRYLAYFLSLRSSESIRLPPPFLTHCIPLFRSSLGYTTLSSDICATAFYPLDSSDSRIGGRRDDPQQYSTVFSQGQKKKLHRKSGTPPPISLRGNLNCPKRVRGEILILLGIPIDAPFDTKAPLSWVEKPN